MDIEVENTQTVLSIDLKSVRPIVESVLSIENEICDELLIHFVEEKEICLIHEHFFDDPSPTDCISLQVDGKECSPRFLGEIFISPLAAIQYAENHQKEIYEELTLYLVHSLLHLLGYKDYEEADIEKMRLAEKRQMAYLKENQLLLKK